VNFGYTGQAWLPSLGLWYYKARMYEPELGRFLQPDPIGYDDSPNLYAYVLNDPINLIDPLGLAKQDIIVIGIKPKDMKPGQGFGGRLTGGLGGVFGPGERSDAQPDAADIVVICDAVCRARRSAAPPPVAPMSIPAVAPAGEPKVLHRARRKKPDWCGSAGANLPEGNWAEACRRHDICYAMPGVNKERCDAQLALGILAECTERIWVPALCAAPAVVGWIIVTIGGHGPFHRAQPRRRGGGR